MPVRIVVASSVATTTTRAATFAPQSLTLPIDPPMLTASVVTARNVSRKKKAPAIRKTGCRSW